MDFPPKIIPDIEYLLSHSVLEYDLKIVTLKGTLIHQAQNDEQFQFNPSFNKLGIYNNFVSVHMSFNNLDACKFFVLNVNVFVMFFTFVNNHQF